MARMAIAPIADAGLDAAVTASERLAAHALAAGLALALDQLGDIAIPDPVSARIDKAQLRALASLYLAADLEPAGVIPAVETLSGLVAGGAAGIDLGAAEPLVAQWWRHRAERPSASERAAFFSRLFGTSAEAAAADGNRNDAFEERMLGLCEALYKLDGSAGADFPRQAQLRSAARALVENLGGASTGVTAFMASEITGTLREALAIVNHADLRQCFGARDVWGVIAGIGRIARESAAHPAAYVRRGKAGMLVLAWLADVADRLAGGTALVTTDNPVIGAAADWIEATLSLGESTAPTPSRAPVAAANPGSWASLGR